MSGDTIRPHLDAELAEEIDDAVREHVRIPPDRLTVGDRVRILLEEYRTATERVGELEEELASRESQVEELEEQVAELQTQSGGGVLGRGR